MSMSTNENHDQVSDQGRAVVLPRSILPGRREHFQTFPPPVAAPRSLLSGSIGTRHLKADITSPIQSRQNRSRPTHFAPPASAGAASPVTAKGSSDPNVSAANPRSSIPLTSVADDERAALDVTERMTVTPATESHDHQLRRQDQLTATSHLILHPSVAPAAISSRRSTHRLIAVLIGVALVALVGLAFAIGFIVGERNDRVPQGGPLAGSVTAFAGTVEMVRSVQQ